jgi:hypothetical protein
MPCTCWTTAQATTRCPDRALLSLVAIPAVTEQAIPLVPGFRIVVCTDGFIEAYGTLGGLDDQEVIELVRRGSSPCAPRMAQCPPA